MIYKVYTAHDHSFICGDTLHGECVIKDKCNCLVETENYDAAKEEYDYLSGVYRNDCFALANESEYVLECTKDKLYEMAIDIRLDREMCERLGVKREEFPETRDGKRQFVSAVKAKIEAVINGLSYPRPTIDFINKSDMGGVVFPQSKDDCMEFEIFPQEMECLEMLRRTDRYNDRKGYFEDDVTARYIQAKSYCKFSIDQRGIVKLGMEYADGWNDVPIGKDECEQLVLKADEQLKKMGMDYTVQKYFEDKFGIEKNNIELDERG